jgi:hypothetical protein
VALGARRWRRRRGTPAAAAAAEPSLDASDSARLNADIERYDL